MHGLPATPSPRSRAGVLSTGMTTFSGLRQDKERSLQPASLRKRVPSKHWLSDEMLNARAWRRWYWIKDWVTCVNSCASSCLPDLCRGRELTRAKHHVVANREGPSRAVLGPIVGLSRRHESLRRKSRGRIAARRRRGFRVLEAVLKRAVRHRPCWEQGQTLSSTMPRTAMKEKGLDSHLCCRPRT